MPNKMIYVSDDDFPVLEEAQELAGTSLSATVIEALKRLIADEKAEAEGFEEMQLRLGEGGTYANKRFFGKELARTKTEAEDRWSKIWIVYKTARHQFALHTKETFEWSLDELMEKKIAAKLKGAPDTAPDSLDKPPAFKLEVFETIEELEGHIPEQLFRLLEGPENGGADDFLDI